MTRTFATIATTLARPAVAALLAAGVLAGAARAQTATPSADQQACLVAKFTRANEVMDAASTQAADLFKSRYPDKAELIDAMRAADSSLRDGSLVVFKHLIATDPSKLNLRDGMGIEIAVPMFTVATELEPLKGTDPSVQELLDRGAAAQRVLEANEAGATLELRYEAVVVNLVAGNRTLYFDFLPLKLPRLRGYSIRVQLYTVPGQVHYDSTRKLLYSHPPAR